VAQRREAGDALDVPGHKERLSDVEHEQRGHAAVGEALSGLGEGEVCEADGFAEEGAGREAGANERGEGGFGYGIAEGGSRHRRVTEMRAGSTMHEDR
jgi:hypothetical protein